MWLDLSPAVRMAPVDCVKSVANGVETALATTLMYTPVGENTTLYPVAPDTFNSAQINQLSAYGVNSIASVVGDPELLVELVNQKGSPDCARHTPVALKI